MVQKMSPNWLPWPASDKRCLLAEQWPGLHPNGGNRLSRIREPELFRRFSHSPHFCDNISAANANTIFQAGIIKMPRI